MQPMIAYSTTFANPDASYQDRSLLDDVSGAFAQGSLEQRIAIAKRHVPLLRPFLGLAMARAAKEEGVALLVVDGSPGAYGSWFKEQLEAHGVDVHEETTKGMNAARLDAGRRAIAKNDPEAVFWLEPEKVGMISHAHALYEHLKSEEASVVIPHRFAHGVEMPGYAAFQRGTELSNNAIINRSLREAINEALPEFDLYSGPRMIGSRTFEAYFDTEELRGPAVKWEGIFYPIVDILLDASAHGPHKPVSSLDVAFIYPPEQAAIEAEDATMDQKRIEQSARLVPATLSRIVR